jgi:hypothetical protein
MTVGLVKVLDGLLDGLEVLETTLGEIDVS